MRKILLVIDMQNDFIDGALGTAEAVAMLPRAIEEIKKYSASDIIATRDTHTPNYMDTQEGKNLPVPHCIAGTPGWELNDAVRAAIGDAEIIDKPTFGSKILAERLADIAENEELDITLIGLCTDICVVSNALMIKAFLPETKVNVIADCCAGVTPATHSAALETMKMCQINVI